MYKKRTYKDYIDILCQEFNISKEQAKKIIQFGNKNLVKSMYQGKEIRLKHIGNITFNKEKYIEQRLKYLKKKTDGKKD